MDTVRMKEELRAMKAAGIGGADIFEIGFRPDGVVPAGPAFMSAESIKVIAFAIKEAGKLGLEIGLNLSSSWNAGGSWITPEHAAKSLYVSRTKVTGKGMQKITIPFPQIPKADSKGKPLLIQFGKDGKPVYHQEVALLAIPTNKRGHYLDTASILNLTPLLDQAKDELIWKVPDGEWELLRYVCSNSGEALKLPSPHSLGPIIDHFDSSATEAHFLYFINKLKPVLGDFKKTALRNFYLASFEATGTVWTPSLAAAFQKINGYELYKFLPYFFDKNSFDSAAATKFKKDYDLTISELMINNHYRKGREIANRYGLQLISESGGPGPPLHNVPVEAIKALGSLDVPRGEFWINHAQFDKREDSIDLLMLVKEIAAASHIYGRKITELESFTSFQNWQEGPGDMRPIGDRAFCEGMNRVVVHGFTHNPGTFGYPGIVYAAGTHYNDKTTWWPKVKPFNDYLSRVSYLLQETSFVADVLYYYGDQVPNFGTPKNTRFAVGAGYDYEIINTEVLLKDLEVKDGQLVLPNGAQFKLLALGELSGSAPAVLEKIKTLARKGAIITFTKPNGVTPVMRNEMAFASTGFLNKNHPPEITDLAPLEILRKLNVGPDFDYADKGSDRLDFMHKEAPFLDYIHYRKGALDFYFIRNTSDKWLSRLCSFRQTKKSPELWDPVTGLVTAISIYETGDQYTKVPLTFPPQGSYFVVFREDTGAVHYKSISSATEHPPRLIYLKSGIQFLEKGNYTLVAANNKKKVQVSLKTIPITGSWNLSFSKGWGAPASAVFPQLISWTASKDSGIKYFSGTATYNKTFLFSEPTSSLKGKSVYLELGKLAKVGEVWLNGKPLGITWSLPHRFDITDEIRNGENTLKIEVVNTWSNRIIGDLHSEKKYTYTNLNVRGSRELLWTETPLLESGLLGPVWLELTPTFGQ